MAIDSVHNDITCLKKLITIIIIIMNKLQETMVFNGEINFCYETKAKKVMIDFKFDALYR